MNIKEIIGLILDALFEFLTLEKYKPIFPAKHHYIDPLTN